MIKYSFQDSDVILELDTTDAEDSVAHEFTGDQKLVDAIKEVLYRSFGMFGHTLDIDSPAIDVNHALMHSEQTGFFKAELLEGADILDNWQSPEFPEGAVS